VREFDASVMDLDEWWPKLSGIRLNLPHRVTLDAISSI